MRIEFYLLLKLARFRYNALIGITQPCLFLGSAAEVSDGPHALVPPFTLFCLYFVLSKLHRPFQTLLIHVVFNSPELKAQLSFVPCLSLSLLLS